MLRNLSKSLNALSKTLVAVRPRSHVGLTHAPLRAALVSGAVKSDMGGRTYSTTTPPSPKLDDIKAHIAMMEQLTCNGCGIELQFDDIAKVGYCTEKALESLESVREISTSLICQRCFQIRNYGKVTDSRMPYDEYEKRVKALKPRDMLVVQLVDILDITGSLLGNARHVVGNKSVMLVVNKGDLIPVKSGSRRLLRRIKQAAADFGIENVIGIRLISSVKGAGIPEVVSDIKRYRQGRDICVIGAANAGKSTFLNALLKHSTKNKRFLSKAIKSGIPSIEDVDVSEVVPEAPTADADVAEEDIPEGDLISLKQRKQLAKKKTDVYTMTTSSLPGTTLAVSPIPITLGDESCNIFDTPGLIVNRKRQKLIEFLSKSSVDELNSILPGKKLPLTIFKMTPGRSLFLGAMLRLDYENDMVKESKAATNSLLFSWYGVLPGHLSKTATHRVDAEETFMKHAGGLLSPPRGLDALSFTGPLVHRDQVIVKDYVGQDVMTRSSNPKKPKRTTVLELVVPGFGWLGVTGIDMDGTQTLEKTLKSARIQISTCEGVEVHQRSALYPFEMTDTNKNLWKQN
ncbi:hypothetical protein H257_18424 [Aphanomyces astaci]|uniref:Uncharacterized protein n=1 Tax=Aphanomyces astaci TaxID=112090 RepID=W4FDD8_APHAT|nr:hypothetical protein H257_18424 [Aphanomyces astaci]ETV64733.1 hypothetical protein H257_18424 [Aphanomyces astaci]|eukprot:XP_009845775.1 hypothetical protein H257_18424 [Aphanomyces astaci]